MNLTLAKGVDRYAGIVVCYALAGLRVLRNFVRRRDGPVEVRTLLLVKFWGLGNIALLLPVIRGLKERFPDARILFVSLRRNRELLDACGDVDERIYINDRNVFTLVGTLLAAVFRARRHRPDLCVDFEQFARASAILAVLARAKQIIGLATPRQGREILYHKPVRYDDRQHMGQTYLDLARAAGVPERLYRTQSIPVAAEHDAQADALLADVPGAADRPVVVMHPGSGDNFQGRRWPAPSFSRLAERVALELDTTVVISGSPGERDLVARVVDGTGADGRVVGASGRLTALGLAALLSRSVLLVTNDTAPVHLGSAVGVPVFAFFGPNTPRLYGPLSRGSHAFYRALPCSPCLTNMNYKTSLCRMPVCIRDIEVDEVFDRVQGHLAEVRVAEALSADASAAETGAADAADPSATGGSVRAGAGGSSS